MAFKGITISDAIISDGQQQGSVYVEPGPYLVEVVGAKPSPEDLDDDKTEYILWGLKILQGSEGVGRKLRHYTYMSEAAQFQLGNLLFFTGNQNLAEKISKSGKTLEEYSDFVEFVALLEKKTRGKKFGVEVADDSFNGNPRSKVMELFPASEFPERFGGGGTVPEDQYVKAVEDDVEEVEDDVEEVEDDVEEAPAPPPKKAPAKTAAALATASAAAAKAAASAAAAKATVKTAAAKTSGKARAKTVEEELGDWFK